ncbi:hypothetical protein [Nocardioides jishulii]|uniref:Uncharacterized protein n=1 Tax=Nocardioides jishulii TaxID=2575440 RepID=A0A4U2YSM1_9ACTN|nr:hypothetical protein [Nocardioides jishulii]QCX26571.1 hypothetical protein FCL41_02690 [Nocardioides jishulii]TKI63622.1 hypothetical protein FC770_00015 [Nocardioides jishulii]
MTHDIAAPTPASDTTPSSLRPRSRGLRSVALAAGVLALVAAAAWFAWLGWDREYYVVDGEQQGPYRAWQVVGCGLTIVVASVLAQWWTRSGWAIPLLAAAATVGFAIPWGVDAAMTDDSGLFVVGLIFLVVGAGAGLTVLLAVTYAVQRATGSLARRS